MARMWGEWEERENGRSQVVRSKETLQQPQFPPADINSHALKPQSEQRNQLVNPPPFSLIKQTVFCVSDKPEKHLKGNHEPCHTHYSPNCPH